MFGQKKKSSKNEDAICALCEFSSERDGKFFCSSKEVSPTGYCGRFIFDPLKKTVHHISVLKKAEDIEFLPLD